MSRLSARINAITTVTKKVERKSRNAMPSHDIAFDGSWKNLLTTAGFSKRRSRAFCALKVCE